MEDMKQRETTLAMAFNHGWMQGRKGVSRQTLWVEKESMFPGDLDAQLVLMIGHGQGAAAREAWQHSWATH